MLLQGLEIVLVKTRFPENIGMAARACVNMGCPTLRLVDPERWDREKARPLATPKGQDLLDAVEVHEDVAQAVAESALVFGTTARVGGWRQALLSPEQAAREAAAALVNGQRVSMVFGPEDRGRRNHALPPAGDHPHRSGGQFAQSCSGGAAAQLCLRQCCACTAIWRKTDRNAPWRQGGNCGRAGAPDRIAQGYVAAS